MRNGKTQPPALEAISAELTEPARERFRELAEKMAVGGDDLPLVWIEMLLLAQNGKTPVAPSERLDAAAKRIEKLTNDRQALAPTRSLLIPALCFALGLLLGALFVQADLGRPHGGGFSFCLRAGAGKVVLDRILPQDPRRNQRTAPKARPAPALCQPAQMGHVGRTKNTLCSGASNYV